MTDETSLCRIPTELEYLKEKMHDLLNSDTLRLYGAGQMNVRDGERLGNVGRLARQLAFNLSCIYDVLSCCRERFVNVLSCQNRDAYKQVIAALNEWRDMNIAGWQGFQLLARREKRTPMMSTAVQLVLGHAEESSREVDACVGHLRLLRDVMTELNTLCEDTMTEVKHFAADGKRCLNAYHVMECDALREANGKMCYEPDPLAAELSECHNDAELEAKALYHNYPPADIRKHIVCAVSARGVRRHLTSLEKKLYRTDNTMAVVKAKRLVDNFTKYAPESKGKGKGVKPNFVWAYMLYEKMAELVGDGKLNNVSREAFAKRLTEVCAEAGQGSLSHQTLTNQAGRPKDADRAAFEEAIRPYMEDVPGDGPKPIHGSAGVNSHRPQALPGTQGVC